MPSLSWTSLWSPASQLHHNTHHSASAVPYPCRDVSTYRVCQETWSELGVSMWTRTAAHCLRLRNQTPNCGNCVPESHATEFSQPKKATQKKCWWNAEVDEVHWSTTEFLGFWWGFGKEKHLWIWRKGSHHSSWSLSNVYTLWNQHFPPENRPQEESSSSSNHPFSGGWKTVSWDFSLWKKPGLPTAPIPSWGGFFPSQVEGGGVFCWEMISKDDSPRFKKKPLTAAIFWGKLKKGVLWTCKVMGSFKKILFNSTFL